MNTFTGLPKLLVAATAAFTIGFAGPSLAQSDVDLENEDNRIAYSIGVNIGQNLVQQ